MVSFFILDFLITKRSVLQGKIVNMQGRFLNLLRDGSITSGKMSDKIKDFSKLLQLVKKETATEILYKFEKDFWRRLSILNFLEQEF